MSPDRDAVSEWVTVAVLTRVWGVRGQLAAIPQSDDPERFQRLGRVFLFGDGAAIEVEEVRFHLGMLLFKFRGIDSIPDAEPLRGAEVRIPRRERLELGSGEFFQSDLIGCEVVERGGGGSLGLVTGWQDAGGAGLLVVGQGMLIPFARAICVSIDVPARRIEVDLPEGLKDLNPS